LFSPEKAKSNFQLTKGNKLPQFIVPAFTGLLCCQPLLLKARSDAAGESCNQNVRVRKAGPKAPASKRCPFPIGKTSGRSPSIPAWDSPRSSAAPSWTFY